MPRRPVESSQSPGQFAGKPGGGLESPHPRDFSAVFKDEMEIWIAPASQLRPGREKEPTNLAQPDQANELVGLALTGGGIRSATFALGACQAMARQGVLERVDYLSTVSGGGYLASGITSLLHYRHLQKCPEPKVGHPMSRGNFPFTFNPLGTPEDTRFFKVEEPTVRHLRQQSNYLAPSLGILDTQTWYALVRMVTRTAINWIVFLIPLFALAVSLLSLTPVEWWSRENPLTTPWVLWGPASAGGALLLIFSLSTILSPAPQPGPFLWINRLLVSLLVSAFVLLGLVIGVWGIDLALEEAAAWFYGAFGAGAAAFVPFLRWAYSSLGDAAEASNNLQNPPFSRLANYGLRLLFGVLGYLLLATAFLLAFIGLDQPLRETTVGLVWIAVPIGWIVVIGVGLWVLVLLLGDWRMRLLNWTSLHSFYKYRLGETYIQRENIHPENQNYQNGKIMVGEAADIKLCTLQSNGRGKHRPAGPYHLINCSVNIAGSADVVNLDRKSDSFIMSCLYTGSTDTGFVSTAKRYEHLTLGTATAISGAAFSPNQGTNTSRSLAILMTLFNARLGYWMSNPASEEDHGKPPIRGGMLYYYLKELFGAASGKDRFIYLTDGGHFDNSGIYELLRRRCRYVIAVDGSGEPSPTSPMFGTLGQLARLARIDFGIDIRMDLRPLTPSPETGKAPSNWAIGTITYPPVERGLSEEERERDRQGMMVYLKAVVTEADNLPDLEFYHRRDNIFPNHPTLDQFFDEAQFEAYRALGYQIAKGIFEGKFRTGSKVNSDREAFNSLCTHR